VHCLRILAGVRFSANPRQVVSPRRPALPPYVKPATPTRHIHAPAVHAHAVSKPPAKPTGLNGNAVIGVGEPAVVNSTALSLGES
jgi:hypothetical protein